MKYIGTTILLFFTALVFAQQVTIKGVVMDADTQEGVPFANVYLASNPQKGVSADFDGVFEIRFDMPPDTLAFSAMSYRTRELPYEGQTTWTVKLSSDAMNLQEVVVTASGEDPAYGIFRKVVKNKPQNNKANLDGYACEVYNKMEVDLINLTDEFINLKINQPFRFVYDHIDSTRAEGQEPFLPLFVTEALSDFYYQKKPSRQKEQVKAVKVVGDIENESVGPLLGIAEAQLNVYDDWLNLVTKKFVSPIADNGTNFYRYYLIDSSFIQDKWCYQIQYFPKHKGINGFYGDFWVHDTTFAIRKIKMQLLEEGHLNFVEKLTITQEYDTVNDSIWMPTKEFIIIASTTIAEPFVPAFLSKKLQDNTPGLQAKRRTTYKKYRFDPTEIAQKVVEEAEVLPNAFGKSDAFWLENRHTALEKSEETAYYLVDTIKTLPVVELWERVTSTIFTGYMWGDYVDIGNFYEFFSGNPIEGFRTKVGLRTSLGVSKKYRFGGYAAYGWKDQRWKFGTDFLYVFNKDPRRSLQLAYLNDYTPNPNFDPYFSSSGEGLGSGYFLRRPHIPFKLLRVEHFSAKYHHDWKNGFSTKLYFSHQYNRPFFNFSYPLDDQNTSSSSFNTTDAGLELRYAYKETVVRGAYDYYSLGSKYPVVGLRYEKGIKGWFGADLDYHRLEAEATAQLRWGKFGFTDLNLRAGKLWGDVPYLAAFVPQGNESVFMNFGGLNTVPEYTFAADQYVFCGFDHHFDGYILQVMPLFRKMRLRSVANFRLFWGDMTARNQYLNAQNLYENTSESDMVRIRIPNQNAFMEASIGVENILRFFRVDAVWRLNYHELDNNTFGVRASVQFRL